MKRAGFTFLFRHSRVSGKPGFFPAKRTAPDKSGNYKTPLLVVKGYLLASSLLFLWTANVRVEDAGPMLTQTKQLKPKVTYRQAPTPKADPGSPYESVDPQITQKLVDLLDETALRRIAPPADPVLTQLNGLLTPEGLELSVRYSNLGILLSEALAWEPVNQIGITSAQFLKQRLLTLARFVHDPDIRSMAILSLTALKDRSDFYCYQEALSAKEIGIRAAAIEALEKCGFQEAVPLLQETAKRDGSPLLKVLAAGSLARLGNAQGLQALRETLGDQDWLLRALAAKALGESGNASDYDLLTAQLSREQILQSNPFVAAEISVAALKLFPKKLGKSGGKIRSASSMRGRSRALALTAPRLSIPFGELADPQIDSQLLRMIRDNLEIQISQNQAPQSATYSQLGDYSTLEGRLLKLRYSFLGVLLMEATAGTRDAKFLDLLVPKARDNRNEAVRSYALLALAYCRDRGHLTVFQDALRSPSIADRFAAVNALDIWAYPETVSILNGVVKLDSSPLIRIAAARALLRHKDLSGKDALLVALDDRSWVTRAMAFRTLGELGSGQDYNRLLSFLGSDQNDFLTVEICTSLLRLHAKRQKR